MAQIHDFKDLVTNALEAVEFKLIRSRSDLENQDLVFHPLMAHQIFGESESIFGYQDLKIRIYYTAGTMQIYLGIEYSNRVNELSNGDIKADDVVATIAEKMPAGVKFITMEEFYKFIDSGHRFRPFFEDMYEFTKRNEDGSERVFQFFKSNYKQPAFIQFFLRLETFVLWFVDAASYVDVDDEQWTFFICYERYKNEFGDIAYATAGYTTVYEYFAYPRHIRPRISQMLVLPPYQKLGIGTKFIETIYTHYQKQRHIKDITVEDPSDDFKRLRNYVDARICLQLKAFKKEEIKKGFNDNMVKEARESFKMSARQARIVYEILRLFHTDLNDSDDYTAYRLDVKRRLNATYYKQMKDIKKMERAKIDTEWIRARLPDTKLRIEQLHAEYNQLEKEYQHIIEKLKTFLQM